MYSMSKLAVVVLFLVALGGCVDGASPLQVGFYKGKCGTFDVEAIVREAVKARFMKDPTIPAALLRMQFHDCFVTGCDASLLLEGEESEKNEGANLTVRGYELIDAVKAALEKACPGVVSCADIIALAARDATALAGRIRYSAETGRRDSTASAKLVDLPSPSTPIPNAISLFAQKGFNVVDMVSLLGAHTVGTTHCAFINRRLYNFNQTGNPDPTMSPALVSSLRKICPENSRADIAVNLDQNSVSSLAVDNSFYRQIVLRRGVLKIDQELALDPSTRNIVRGMANGTLDFSVKFGEAMIKLGAFQVLTGTQGQIRTSCRAVNANN